MIIFDYLKIAYFIHRIDPQIKVTFAREKMWANIENKEINIDVTDNEDMGFRKHIYNGHKFKDVNKYSLLMWSILHEIGHIKTPKAKDDMHARTLCAMVSEETARKDISIQNLYFNIPCEWQATEWAINFIKRNQKFVKKFDKKFYKFS